MTEVVRVHAAVDGDGGLSTEELAAKTGLGFSTVRLILDDRNAMNVAPTKQDKGLTLTVTVTAYDNGLIEVDGRPINKTHAQVKNTLGNEGHGWVGAASIAMQTLAQFQTQVRARRDAIEVD